MEFIRAITHQEMLRRWALGEIHKFSEPQERRAVRKALLSQDHAVQAHQIERLQAVRTPLLLTLPPQIDWRLASLHLAEDEFRLLWTLNDEGWEKHTQGSFRFVDAAGHLRVHPEDDPRVRKITALARVAPRQISWDGITLLGHQAEGPLIIAEGTARLVALYNLCIYERIPLFGNNAQEVAIGLSDQRWERWTPPQFPEA